MSIQVFTDSLSLTYYLCILRFIYPIPFPIDCVINQFTKGARGASTRRQCSCKNWPLEGARSTRISAGASWPGGEGEKRFGVFRPQGLPAVPGLPHLAAQTGKWRPEERAWLSRRRRRGGGGFCAVPGGCGVGADRAGGLRAGAARHVPGAPQLPARWDPRHPRWLLQRGGPIRGGTGIGETSMAQFCPPRRRWSRWCGRRTPAWGGRDALRRPHSQPLT